LMGTLTTIQWNYTADQGSRSPFFSQLRLPGALARPPDRSR